MTAFYIGIAVVAAVIVFAFGMVAGFSFAAWVRKEVEMVEELDFALPEEEE